MGDLQRRPMDRVTGASGPALVLRALFAHLNRNTPARALPKPSALLRLRVCSDDGFAPHAKCTRIREEWFADANPPRAPRVAAQNTTTPRIRQPAPGLRLAIDPRVPRAAQRFRFALTTLPEDSTVEWLLDGKAVDACADSDCLWTLQTGVHTLFARIWQAAERSPSSRAASQPLYQTSSVRFSVF